MNGYRHYAGLKGTKVHHVGQDESAYLYTDIQSAIDAAQANDVILIHPGTYTLSTKLSITKPLRFVGLGGSGSNGVKITCDDDLATAMVDIELVAQAAAAELWFQDIKFLHGDDNLDIFDVNNTTVAQNMTITFQNCDLLVYDSASTGKAIDISHATAAKTIGLYMGSCRQNITGCINFTFKDAGDVLKVVGMQVLEDGNATGIITSADDLAAGIVLHGCQFTHEKATSGGHATQTLKSYFCHTGAALVDTNDLIGSHTETIVA